jgi:DNA-binding MarR family transcriptional regulator
MGSTTDVSTFGWLIADIARLNRKLADRRLSGVGMTRAQWQALGNLKRMGPMTQAALAEVLEIETATVARLIDRLEAAGWVERSADSQDRRVKLISPSGKANAVMDEVGVIGQKLREDVLSDFSEPERQQLVELLSVVKSRLIHLLEYP